MLYLCQKLVLFYEYERKTKEKKNHKSERGGRESKKREFYGLSVLGKRGESKR